ncbi:MAG: hypothetical protein KJ072_13830 [Verrucomicrobia bacterium]|nr:hypothetical protein [Verrucomicrobiota bacterium]
MLCLVGSQEYSLSQSATADSPEIIINSPLDSGSACASLTLIAPPGDYLIQTSSSMLDSWRNETNVTVVNGNSVNLMLPIEGRSTLFIRAEAYWPPNEVIFQTLGDSFEPEILCEGDGSPLVRWTWSDGTTSIDYPVAFKDFGSPAPRLEHLATYEPNVLTAINLGFDGADGGDLLPLNQRPPQNVGAVSFPYPLTRLKYWASSYNPITNTLDFTGFASLESIELFKCTPLQQVKVSNLQSLQRIVVEDCNLQELDLSGNPSLGDVRCAENAFTNIVLGGGTGPNIWHWCTRDNPQLTQQFQEVMTNFFSLREFWSWNNNQGGSLSFVSSNLNTVWAYENDYTSLDLTGHRNLQSVLMSDNSLTNILIGESPVLREFDAHDNQLTTGVLDSLLALLDTSAPRLTFVNLSQNSEPPSATGFAHYSNLVARGVVAFVDWPESNDGRLNVPGGPQAITFVTGSRHPHLEIRTQSGTPVNITWHWGDGTITRGALVADHDFGTAGVYTNYVEVSPPGAVTYFGAPRTAPGQGITAVYGAANFPSLNFLYLYQENVTELSLAGCANLRQLHLAANPVSEAVCDQWFIDLDAAVTGPVTAADFWYPANKRTSASDAAWTSLVQKGFVMRPF